jgi:hypothetical protein
MISALEGVLVQPAFAQGALNANGAHNGVVVDCGIFGNMFRSIQFVISAQTVTDGTHTVTVQETPYVNLVTLGAQSSGTFNLSWNSFVTSAIPYNATATQVLAALVALPTALGGGSWNVTGAAGGPYTVTSPWSAPLGGSGALLTTPGNFAITSGAVGAYTLIDPVAGGVQGSRINGVVSGNTIVPQVLPVMTAANSNQLIAFGVVHTLRYVQMVITSAGTTTGGVFSAVAVMDSASKGPVSRA